MKKTTIDYDAEGLVFDIDRFATHDGPGIRMTVFLKGCPLSCAWCHSPESQNQRPELVYFADKCIGCWSCITACPEQALSPHRSQGKIEIDKTRCTHCGVCTEACCTNALQQMGRWMTVQELIALGLRDKIFYDLSCGGVTLTGGEITLQHEFSINFTRAARKQEIHTAIETSGYSPWEVLREIACDADLILYDLKVMDPKMHRRYIGTDNHLILENLERLKKSFPQKTIQVRIPLIPGVSDSEENVRETAKFMKKLGLFHLALLPYNESASAKYQWLGRAYSLHTLKTQSPVKLDELKEVASALGLKVETGI